jgi:hypothetical protein
LASSDRRAEYLVIEMKSRENGRIPSDPGDSKVPVISHLEGKPIKHSTSLSLSRMGQDPLAKGDSLKMLVTGRSESGEKCRRISESASW